MELWQSIGMDLYQAVARVNDNIGLASATDAVPASETNAAASNDAALAELGKLMGGVGGLFA